MPSGSIPSFREPLVDPKTGQMTPVWYRYFQDEFSNGPTSARPTKGLYVGRPYFDTTLGYRIWYSGTAWVDATGAGV